MSIATQIQALTQDRNDIRAALVAKGVTSATGSGFDEFATDIANIPSGGGGSGTLEIDITDPCSLAGTSVDVSQYSQITFVADGCVDPCTDPDECVLQGGEWIEDGEGGGYCTLCEEA